MAPSRRHSPFAGAIWMVVTSLCFAAVNSLSQQVSLKLGTAIRLLTHLEQHAHRSVA